MPPARRLAALSLYCVEELLPAVCFVLMFSVFLAEIVARYFFNNPLLWTYEVSTLAYTWTIMFGACLAARHRTHIKFDLLYEKFSRRSRLMIDIGGNVAVILLFLAALYPSWDFISFSKVSKTPVLLIPMSIGFFPFLVFLVLTMVHLGVDTYRAVQALRPSQRQQQQEPA